MNLEGFSDAFKSLFFESYVDELMDYENLQARGADQRKIMPPKDGIFSECFSEEEKKEPGFRCTEMYTDKCETFNALCRAFVTCP